MDWIQRLAVGVTRFRTSYRARPAGFFCFGVTITGADGFTPLFSSIQASSSDFLNRHRFPSLNAGMNPSDAYRYSVSPLIPRYSDACRISITSRGADHACAIGVYHSNSRNKRAKNGRARSNPAHSLYPHFLARSIEFLSYLPASN